MPAKTRDRLLDVAEDLARSRGYGGFSFGDLSDSLGIRRASIHYHFPSKAHLAAALMFRYYLDTNEYCQAAEGTSGTGAARIQDLIAYYRSALGAGDHLCLCVAFSLHREALPDVVQADITRFRGAVRSWLTQWFWAGGKDGSIAGVGDPDAEGTTCLALLEGAQIAARAEGDVARFDACLSILQARFS